MNEELKRVIQPIVECELSLSDQKMALHRMFTLAVANAPENETDNYTAKTLSPAYLALCELLKNVREIQ